MSFIVFAFFSYSQNSCPDGFSNGEISHLREVHERVKKSVWTLSIQSLVLNVGTAFFISPNQFVSNFHVVENLRNSSFVFLSQNKKPRKRVKIKQILALSSLHDLALFEIEQSVDFYLQVGKTPPSKEDDLFIAGNKGGTQFQVLEKTDPILYSELTQSFTANLHSRDHQGLKGRLKQMLRDPFNKQRRALGGMSGSPVYDTNGQVVGVFSGAFSGYLPPDRHQLFFQSLDQLQNLINKEQKLNCTNFTKCIKDEKKRLELYAESENLLAQIQLFTYRFRVPKTKRGIEKLIDPLEPLAQNGWVHAQFKLAQIYSLVGNDERSFYWFEQLAQQGYPSAYNALME